MRLLFVYGFAPSGHASAAKALEARALALGHATTCLDITSDYHRVLGPAINSVYMTLIESFPNLWTTIHENESAAEILSNWRKVYHLFEGQRLRSTVEELKPDRIVCTHAGPFAALTLAKEKGALAARLIGLVTDFHAHPYWAVPGADLYLTATAAAAESLVQRGIARSLVLDTGIPIHPLFDQPPARAEARRLAGVAQGEPVILLSGGSRGLGRVAEAAAALLAGLPGVSLLAVCGSNAALRKELTERFAAEPRLKVFGAVTPESMRDLMAAADLLVGKAGGLTSAECLALGLPLIILDPIAGQEERNAAFLEQSGAALSARAVDALAGLAACALEPAKLEGLRRGARALGRPKAGGEALAAILGS